ncbi:uncharacterized protein FIESC28_08907 [Fusarium coffeatum]|uniref:Uncharacterized protein n=1 Tax=Fusarium coffeatum TaxID=231269 RepID=A0A366R5X7_9HYPO|nr:uncharacterized protein FIESC28_08907 [Fusarium coffeatum]RBR11680.1 hypothetical protein FIESC28_08907 [Fusarium coffeatum]
MFANMELEGSTRIRPTYTMAHRVTDLIALASTTATNPRLVEATYVMTREKAMEKAGDIAIRLGNRGCDQASLATGMAHWLSEPVIKVLSEEYKNKVFMWCAQHDETWLETVRSADEDLLEYQYVAMVEAPDAPTRTTDNTQEMIMERIDAAKEDILEAHRQGLAAIMAKMELLQTQDQSSVGLSPTKRRRVNTRSSANANLEKMRKIDQALRKLLGDNSQLVQFFNELASTIDAKFNDIQSESHGQLLWSKEEQEKLRKETRSHGVSVIEYKLLDRSLQEMQDADLPIANLAALSRLLVSADQFNQLAQKFPFPFQCEEE